MPHIPRKVHFVGIGGVGMSGIAKVLIALGHEVSGSDVKKSPTTDQLQALGARIHYGHEPAHIGDAGIVVASSAVRPDNPELLAAHRRKICVVPRAEMLGRLMLRQKGVAVAGAHGKTTTTALTAVLLEKAGFDPTYVVGGEAAEIGNAALGWGDYCVAEADESDGSFLLLDPQIAIVTNIENDHLDHYHTVDNIEKAFEDFLKRIPPEGVAILCADDPVLRRLAKRITCPVITYGCAPDAQYRIADFGLNCVSSGARVFAHGKYLGRLELAVHGRHNLLNALAVTALGRHLGLEFEEIAHLLKSFRGVKRRFQTLGEVGGVRVIDDYAHHPTEIRATLATARQISPKRLIAVFQPHRYTRTQHLYQDFGRSFDEADLVLINGIYSAGEEPIEGVTAGLIVDEIRQRRNTAFLVESQEELVRLLSGVVREGDLVMTMGAGNIWQSGVELLKRMGG